MWSDAARAASVAVRGGTSGGNVAAQGVAAQGAMNAAASRTNAYAGRGYKGRGGPAVGQNVKTGGSASVGGVPVPTHGTGVDNVARSMGGNGSQQDTRPDKTRIDQLNASSAPINRYQTDRASGTIDNIQARQSNATMVGDHTTPPALQRYLD